MANTSIQHAKRIATLGTTGNRLGVVPHLHLQFEWVKDQARIAVDPLRLYGHQTFANQTGDLKSERDFQHYQQQHAESLKPWNKFQPNKYTPRSQ